MAIFTIAGDNGKAAVYPKEKDLRNLLFYGYNHRTAMEMGNLYNLGIECIYNQFLYLQWRRVKRLNTRALHYILSFDTQRWEKNLSDCELTSIMCFVNEYLFGEYQHILFLHRNNQTHYHIHIIVNLLCTERLEEVESQKGMYLSEGDWRCMSGRSSTLDELLRKEG